MKVLAVIALIAVLAGCSGGVHRGGDTIPARSGSTSAAAQSGQLALAHEARAALDANQHLSVFVLWRNRLPAWAMRSTGGPALAALRSAATGRRARGIRVRLLSDRRWVVSISLDPSYTTATAIVIERERVQPSGRDGHPLGQAVILDERATYELRRVHGTGRFLVWRVVVGR